LWERSIFANKGGHVLAQDEASSVVWGMPGSVVAAGLADAVYPLNRMAGEIVRLVAKQRAGLPVSAANKPALFSSK
jgi:two-component system, chemotaxis family, protein-glutamate methylesterase/glutaminase